MRSLPGERGRGPDGCRSFRRAHICADRAASPAPDWVQDTPGCVGPNRDEMMARRVGETAPPRFLATGGSFHDIRPQLFFLHMHKTHRCSNGFRPRPGGGARAPQIKRPAGGRDVESCAPGLRMAWCVLCFVPALEGAAAQSGFPQELPPRPPYRVSGSRAVTSPKNARRQRRCRPPSAAKQVIEHACVDGAPATIGFIVPSPEHYPSAGAASGRKPAGSCPTPARNRQPARRNCGSRESCRGTPRCG